MNIKIYTLISIILLTTGITLSAQSTITFIMGRDGQRNVMVLLDDKAYPCDTLDRVLMRVNYSYAFVRDTVSGYTEAGTGTLEIGRNFTKYWDRMLFDSDSLVRHGHVRSYSKALDGAEVDQITLMEAFIHDLKGGKWTCTGRIVTQDFLYVDNTSDMVWDISDSVSKVAGYDAVMATCSFRGRDYTAWFTPDIPVSAGPWKFSGLPGLILSVRDAEGYYDFRLDGIYSTTGSIFMTDWLYLKTRREKYMEARTLMDTRPAVAKQRYWVNTDVEYEPSRKALKRVIPLGNDYMEKDL